jgi:hypothetical protein
MSKAGVKYLVVYWRRVSVRECRTATDWAEEIRTLLEEDFPNAEKVILVCDNLNTHTIVSLRYFLRPRLGLW